MAEGPSFSFREGKLRITHIAMGTLSVQVSQLKKLLLGLAAGDRFRRRLKKFAFQQQGLPATRWLTLRLLMTKLGAKRLFDWSSLG